MREVRIITPHNFSCKLMWIENISYILTFVISAGMSTLGIMLAYQLYQQNRKPLFATLLYQQIFLFSFLLYGVWGNIALRAIISDLNISEAISSKLAVFIPIMGIPFMVVSWFMLLKFAYNLNGYKFSKFFVFGYFPTFILLVLALVCLIQYNILIVPADADLFVVRIIVGLNLLTHLFFLLPFFTRKISNSLQKETGFYPKWAVLFFASTICYSVLMSFFNVFDFISTCTALVITFASSIFLPAIIRIKQFNAEDKTNIDFQAFCSLYEISKREAQIIREICSGKSNKAIADKLFITLQTVKDHNHRIYTKTGVKSRVQLSNLVREKTGRTVS